METWTRWRLPVAWLLIAAAAASLTRALLAVVPALTGRGASLVATARSADADILPLALLVALGLAGLLCLAAAPTRASRTAAVVAGALLVVTGLADLARLVIVATGRPSGPASAAVVAGLVARLLVTVAGVVALSRAGRTPQPVQARVAEPDPSAVRPDPETGAAAPLPTPAVWNPDPAAGTVWRRAGDAATGAPGVVRPAAGDDGSRRAPDWRPEPDAGQPDEPA